MIDFIKLFLSSIEICEEEVLYLVLCVIDFFKDISQRNKTSNFIKFSEYTHYVCEYYVKEENTSYQLPTI